MLISHYYHTCSARTAMCERTVQEIYLKKENRVKEKLIRIILLLHGISETSMETRVSVPFLFSSPSSSSSSFPSFLFKIEFITGDDSMTSYRGWPDRETKKPPSCSPIRLMDFGKPDGYCSLRTLNPFSTIDGSSR